MIVMNMYQKVRKFKKRKYSQKRIAEELKMDRRTVRKYCEMSETEYVQNRNNLQNKDRVFDLYRDEILAFPQIRRAHHLTNFPWLHFILPNFPEYST